MPLPSLLLIGAQKAGTTSLAKDLLAQPSIGGFGEKEPNVLIQPWSLRKMADVYEALADQAAEIHGDFSTTYSMFPMYRDVPSKAVRLLGDSVHLLYIVRNPLERSVSHYHHWLARDLAGNDIDQELRLRPCYLDFSRYALQLDQWTDHIARDRILVILFEDYVNNREETIRKICRLVDVPHSDSHLSSARHENASGSRAARGSIRRLINSDWYRYRVRPRLPQKMRRMVRDRVVGRGVVHQVPSLETLEWMASELWADARQLRENWNVNPSWELLETAKRLSS